MTEVARARRRRRANSVPFAESVINRRSDDGDAHAELTGSAPTAPCAPSGFDAIRRAEGANRQAAGLHVDAMNRKLLAIP